MHGDQIINDFPRSRLTPKTHLLSFWPNSSVFLTIEWNEIRSENLLTRKINIEGCAKQIFWPTTLHQTNFFHKLQSCYWKETRGIWTLGMRSQSLSFLSNFRVRQGNLSKEFSLLATHLFNQWFYHGWRQIHIFECFYLLISIWCSQHDNNHVTCEAQADGTSVIFFRFLFWCKLFSVDDCKLSHQPKLPSEISLHVCILPNFVVPISWYKNYVLKKYCSGQCKNSAGVHIGPCNTHDADETKECLVLDLLLLDSFVWKVNAGLKEI